MQILLVAFSRRICCSRVERVSTKPRLPSASTVSPHAVGAIYFYLFAYLIASFAVFGVMVHVAGTDDADQQLDHYAGLARQNPFLATVLAVGLGSLAGIPPLAGFMGKFFVFIAAYEAGARWLLAIAATGVQRSGNRSAR